MKYSQIGEVLNDVFDELIGESELITEDLSNIVSVGKTITSNTTFNDNFENYAGKLIDRVGKVIFHEDQIDLNELPIYKDSWEYGSLLEKIRVDYPDTEEDQTFDLANYTGEHVFDFKPASYSAKFFNNSTTFRVMISLPKRQLKSAFDSASNMSRLISAIENAVKSKIDIDTVQLQYRTIANLIAEKFKSGNSLVNLVDLYRSETGDTTVTSENFLYSEDALKFANKTINMYSDLIKKPSILYGDGGYTNITSKARQKLLVLTDFKASLDTYLYSGTYHEEYVKLDSFYKVPYWQAGGTDDSYENRSTIDVIPASEGTDGDTRLNIIQSNILGVLFDERACAINCEHNETEKINVPDARFMNFWFFRDAQYLNDTDENVVVFYLDDYRYLGKFSSQPSDFTTSTYYEKVDGEYEQASVFSASTIYYKKIV